jgi:hypothetical protein
MEWEIIPGNGKTSRRFIIALSISNTSIIAPNWESILNKITGFNY